MLAILCFPGDGLELPYGEEDVNARTDLVCVRVCARVDGLVDGLVKPRSCGPVCGLVVKSICDSVNFLRGAYVQRLGYYNCWLKSGYCAISEVLYTSSYIMAKCSKCGRPRKDHKLPFGAKCTLPPMTREEREMYEGVVSDDGEEDVVENPDEILEQLEREKAELALRKQEAALQLEVQQKALEDKRKVDRIKELRKEVAALSISIEGDQKRLNDIQAKLDAEEKEPLGEDVPAVKPPAPKAPAPDPKPGAAALNPSHDLRAGGRTDTSSGSSSRRADGSGGTPRVTGTSGPAFSGRKPVAGCSLRMDTQEKAQCN